MSHPVRVHDEITTFLGRDYEFMRNHHRPVRCTYCHRWIKSTAPRWRQHDPGGHWGFKTDWNRPYLHYHQDCLRTAQIMWALEN